MPDAMKPETPEGFLASLREQAEMFGKLEALSTRQRSLVSREDARPLLEMLAERQKITDQLVRAAGSLEPVLERWQSWKDAFSEEQRREAERLLDAARQSLRRVMSGDEKDARVLYARKQQAAKVLGSSHSAAKAMNAYQAENRESPRGDSLQVES